MYKKGKILQQFANISLSKAGKFFLYILPISHIRDRLMHSWKIHRKNCMGYIGGKMSLK
jgi:hypothetical protein